ncbi:hypothetical protein [Methanobacterium sp.]|nr:hypothetical protein [Methanobacterium sp.]MDY9923669.1 hypothetical protein [Methanobacterium sp.]
MVECKKSWKTKLKSGLDLLKPWLEGHPPLNRENESQTMTTTI